MNDDSADELRTKLNQETSRLAWSELQRFFAAGAVIFVDAELDLLDVAVCVARDAAGQVAAWMNVGKVARVSDAQALVWAEQNAELWAVVVKPWILVQEADKPVDPRLH